MNAKKKQLLWIGCLFVLLCDRDLAFSAPELFPGQSQMEAEIEWNMKEIVRLKKETADEFARAEVLGFFSERVKRLGTLSESCAGTRSRLIRDLENPPPLPERQIVISSASQAWSQLDALTETMFADSGFRARIEDSMDRIKHLRKMMQNIESQLSLDRGQVIYLLPKPSSEIRDSDYREALWKHYRAGVAEYGDAIRLELAACPEMDSGLGDILRLRRDRFNELFSSLGETYVRASGIETAVKVAEARQGPPELSVALEVRQALHRLDGRYRQALLHNADHFQARRILSVHENVASLLLGYFVPYEADPKLRAAAKAEIDQSIKNARKTSDFLKQHKPSEWLNRRLELIEGRIGRNELSCAEKCEQELKNARELIAASEILEDVSDNEGYAVLAADCLDRAEGRQ